MAGAIIMAWSQTDIDVLRAAIATGAKRVRFQTHETEFRSQKEMIDLLEIMNAEADPSIVAPRRTVAQFTSGF